MEWAFVVSDGVSVTSYGPHYKALGVCYGLCTVFNLIFNCPNFGGRSANKGSTMVPLGMELESSHRLSIQTTLVSGTIWPQCAMQVLTVDCQPPFWVEGVVVIIMGSEIGPLSSPGTISYRLPIVNIGLLSVTVFAVFHDGQTDGRNWSSKWRHYELIKSASAAKKVQMRPFQLAKMKKDTPFQGLFLTIFLRHSPQTLIG